MAEKPRHGYELIKALEERSGGFYVPSPGMIYPALSYLEEIGYATVAPDASRKLYSVSEEGRLHLDRNRALAEQILTGLELVGAKMESVRRVFAGEDPSDEGEYAPGSPEDLYAARRQLKLALHEKRGCLPEEGSRIAAILKRAAAEILGK
ncbi:MAG TPA: PadR family transcriptional regulator [Candidatus Binataceae bacterium]|nr:PadR family transcriptional regulator [Candidatus Binataceae bacterium]